MTADEFGNNINDMSEKIKHNFEQAESVKLITEAQKTYTDEEIAEIEKERTISDAELLTSEAYYKVNEKRGEKKLIATQEQIQKINETVEKLLAQGILTQESLNNGDLEIHFEEPTIGYEFEVEKEQRKMVDATNFQVLKWQNHVIDTYDQSGRCRIRLKNNEPRLSLKIPLLSQDTDEAKCCIRLEFKPSTKEQAEELLKIKELIMEEEGVQTHEKWGTPINLTNGDKVWINKDDQGKYWIETDENHDVKELLPNGITYLGHSKSKIKITGNDSAIQKEAKIQEHFFEKDPLFQSFQQSFSENIETMSRSAKGVSDTSVSKDKEKLDLEGEELANQVKENISGLARYIWENKLKQFKTVDDIRKLVNDIADLANNKLSEKRAPNAFRSHEVPYGRKILPNEIEGEMEIFYGALLEKINNADNGSLNFKDLAKWIELEINRNIHPYADGCGKIANSLSAFFLARYNNSLPHYVSRKDYYAAMNQGEEAFGEYYQQTFNKEKE